MDPATASALIGGASKVLTGALTPPPAGPSTAIGSSNGQGGDSGGGLDFSGFTVALNGSTANGAPHATGMALSPTEMIIIGVAVVLAIKAYRGK